MLSEAPLEISSKMFTGISTRFPPEYPPGFFLEVISGDASELFR